MEKLNSMTNSPLIVIKVGKPEVDEIIVYREDADGWKINGSKNGEPVWSLDQLQDDFGVMIKALAKHVDGTSKWCLMPDEREISAWDALILLVDEGAQAENLQ